MNKEVATLIVGGVVAVGTLLYYLFFDEKEKPMAVERRRSGAGKGRSASTKSSEPTFQEYPKSTNPSRPTPQPLSKPVQCKPVPTKSNSLSDRASSSSPIHSSSPETSQAPVSISSPNSSFQNICKVCDVRANAKFLPCEHQSFCRKHVDEYIRLADDFSVMPKCPECRDVIRNIE